MLEGELPNKVEATYAMVRPKRVCRRPVSQTFNGAQVEGPCPPRRVLAWSLALGEANFSWLTKVHEIIMKELRRVDSKDLGDNGADFFQQLLAESFPAYPVIQFMGPLKRFDEPHFDGGASALHAGLGLWGRRVLRLLAAPAPPRSSTSPPPAVLDRASITDSRTALRQTPGDFYVGGLFCPYHVVEHEGDDRPDELLEIHGQRFKVAIMLRTDCFGAARARGKNSSPGPLPVFRVVRDAIHDALGSARLQAPTLEQCLEVFANL